MDLVLLGKTLALQDEARVRQKQGLPYVGISIQFRNLPSHNFSIPARFLIGFENIQHLKKFKEEMSQIHAGLERCGISTKDFLDLKYKETIKIGNGVTLTTNKLFRFTKENYLDDEHLAAMSKAAFEDIVNQSETVEHLCAPGSLKI